MTNEEYYKKVVVKVALMITEKRQAKKMSLYQLSKLTGATIGHLSRIERGLNMPRIDVLSRIFGALDLKLTIPIRL